MDKIRVLVLGLLLALVPNVALALSVVTGASTTYTSGQVGAYVLRSNSGGVMHDLLPGGGSALAADSIIATCNDDATGLLEVKAGTGSNLDGGPKKYIVLGPRQCAKFLSDGTDYRTVERPARIKIGTVTTINVSPSGDDELSGIDTGTAVQSMQRAWDMMILDYDLNNLAAVIKLAHGTYTKGLIASYLPVGWNTAGIPLVIVSGDTSSPGSVIIRPTTGDAFLVSTSAYLYIEGMRIEAPATGAAAIRGVFYSFTTVWDAVQFGPTNASGMHMVMDSFSYINTPKPYELVGGGTQMAHVWSSAKGHILVNTANIYVRESFTFTAGFAHVNTFGQLSWLATVNFDAGKTITGTKYYCYTNCILQGANKLPGSGTYLAEQGQAFP